MDKNKEKTTHTLQYITKSDNEIVGIKLPFGVNLFKDAEKGHTKGYILEFAKRQFGESVLAQIKDDKKSVITFGLEPFEARLLEMAFDEVQQL